MKKMTNAFMILLACAATLGCLISCVYTANLAARIDQVARTSRADMNYLRGIIRNLEEDLPQSVLERLDAVTRPTEAPADQTTPDIPEMETAAPIEETAPETPAPLETYDENRPVILPETGFDEDTATATDEDTAEVTVELPENDSETTPVVESDTETQKVSVPETIPEWEIILPETEPETVIALESDPESVPAFETVSSFESETVPETVPETEIEAEAVPETDTVDLPTHNRPETEPPAEDPVPDVVVYTVEAYKGHIGVFDATGRLVREVNVFLFALPMSDREALAVGIPAYSREEMVAIVARYE